MEAPEVDAAAIAVVLGAFLLRTLGLRWLVSLFLSAALVAAAIAIASQSLP